MTYLNDLTQEVRLVVRNLNEMYVHFGHVSKLMSRMRGTINNMEQNMLMMPIMGEQMAEMGDDTGRMQRDVGYMNSTITTLDHQIGALNANVWDMSMRFRNVNSSVMHIRQDVNQFDRALPWPPSN